MGLGHNPSISTNGLIFYLDAGSIRSYPGAGDANFSSVSMLLLGETTADSSSNAVTMTATGTAAASATQAKFGTKSLFFEAGSNYLSTPDNAIFQLGSSNWTIECWVYVTSNTGINGFISKRNSSTYDAYCLGTDNSDQFWITITNTAGTWTLGGVVLGTGVTTNTWHHLACVRSGNTITGYVNGVAGTSYSFTGSVYETGGKSVFIGNSDGGNSGQNFKGYIDDFRFTKGVARYTANFTPPARQFPLSNALTWSDLRGNFNDGSLINGPTSNSANGGSIVFDGTNDSVTVLPSSIFSFGTGDFTIEGWINFAALPSTNAISPLLQNDAVGSSNNDKFWFGLFNDAGTNTLRLGRHATSTGVYCSWSVSINVWYYIVATRSSGTVALYINGASQSVTNATALNLASFSQNGLAIGAISTPYYLNGKLGIIKLYNRALSATEVAQNYNALRGRYGV